MFADDGGIADLAVTKRELVMDKANRTRIVRALGGCEGLAEGGDAARGLAASCRQSAVHPPQIREPGGLDPFARFGNPSQCLGCLTQVVKEQVGLGQGTPDLNLLFARKTGTPERPGQQCRRVSTTPLGQGLDCLGVRVGRAHGGEYTSYTVIVILLIA